MGALVAAPISGTLLDRVGRRGTVALGALLFIAGGLWQGLAGFIETDGMANHGAHNAVMRDMLLGRLVAGMGNGMSFGVSLFLCKCSSSPYFFFSSFRLISFPFLFFSLFPSAFQFTASLNLNPTSLSLSLSLSLSFSLSSPLPKLRPHAFHSPLHCTHHRYPM